MANAFGGLATPPGTYPSALQGLNLGQTHVHDLASEEESPALKLSTFLGQRLEIE